MIRGKWSAGEDGKLIPYVEEKKEVNAPFVITDEMEPMLCHADGKYYTSKSKMAATHRRMGFVEMGNEIDYQPKRQKPHNYDEQMEKDFFETYYACRDGNFPLDELDRERFKMIDHNRRHYNHDNREYDEWGKPRE